MDVSLSLLLVVGKEKKENGVSMSFTLLSSPVPSFFFFSDIFFFLIGSNETREKSLFQTIAVFFILIYFCPGIFHVTTCFFSLFFSFFLKNYG